MEKYELIAPCHFGLEAVLKREILDLGYEISKVEDGKVTFLADAQGIADANIFLRTTERILLKTGEVKRQLPLMSFLRKQKLFPGKDISQRMGVSGWQKPIPLKASFLVLRIFSQL